MRTQSPDSKPQPHRSRRPGEPYTGRLISWHQVRIDQDVETHLSHQASAKGDWCQGMRGLLWLLRVDEPDTNRGSTRSNLHRRYSCTAIGAIFRMLTVLFNPIHTGGHIIAILLLFASPPKFLTADPRANILLPCKGNRKIKSGK
jgi:hypothetical protein